MDMNSQRELHKENRKMKPIENKAEHARQQQAIELQKLELQTRVSKALFSIIQKR